MSSVSSSPPPPADMTLQHTPPPLSPPESTAQLQRNLYRASLVTLFAAPALLLVPPRKLDLYTFSLCGAFVVSANHQTKARTGDGLLMWLGRAQERDEDATGAVRADARRGEGEDAVRRHTTPLAPIVTGSILQETRGEGGKDLRAWDRWAKEDGALLGADGRSRSGRGVLGQLRERSSNATTRQNGNEANGAPEAPEDISIVKRIWFGDEGSDWKAQRMREERAAAEAGKSTQEVIMDQVWSVWNWGAETKEEGKRKWEEQRK